MRNKARTMARSLSFKSNKKPIEKPEFKKKWASTGEQQPRKFSIRRKKRSKEENICWEYRKNALEILEKETPVKVQKRLKTAFKVQLLKITLNIDNY